MEQSDVERAAELLKRAARELEAAGSLTAEEVRVRLRSVAEGVLNLLDEDVTPDEPGDVLSRLERQSQEIAEDLRRVERLMRSQSPEDNRSGA